MGSTIDWDDEFQKMGLDDSGIGISRASSRHEYNFQHSLNHQENKNNIYPNTFDPTVTLRYRDSVSSSASSLSRNSTISSTDTRYFSTVGSPSMPQSPTFNTWHHSNVPSPLNIPAHRIERSVNLSPVQHQYQQNHIPFSIEPQPLSIVEPTGCFVPIKALPFTEKNDITKHHYVVPTFAMAGESQAEVMKLLLDQEDSAAFKPKEEYEKTIPWHIDGNSSLVTLSQYTSLGQDNPVTRNYLIGLGRRLGITTIVVIVSIEVIDTVYPLLDNLVKSMELDSDTLQQDQPSWWNRVVLVINQQHGVSDQAAYNQRKSILIEDMPKIQARYRLSTPLSILFLSTQVYNVLHDTNQGTHYKSCCQRILWQMMEKHMLGGRWCSELIGLQTRVPPNTSLINILNENDESSSSSDDAIFKTVIDFVDGKKKKQKKTKKKTLVNNNNHLLAPPTPLQRRSTRRQFQKLHSYDGDNGTTLPIRHM